MDCGLALILASVMTFQTMHATLPAGALPANPGILPDSPLYPLDLMWDSFTEWIASFFGPEYEASVKIAHLKERLAELYVMAEENKTAEVEKVLYLINVKVRELENLSQNCPRCSMICWNAINQTQKMLELCLHRCPKQAKYGLEKAIEDVKRAEKNIAESYKHCWWHRYWHRGGMNESCGNCTCPCCGAS